MHGVLSTALSTSCQFKPLEMLKDCVIDLEGENMDMQTSSVPGFVTIVLNDEQMNTSSCKQTKEVIIFNGKGNEVSVVYSLKP